MHNCIHLYLELHLGLDLAAITITQLYTISWMTVEEWELIAHPYAYRRDSNVLEQEDAACVARWNRKHTQGYPVCMETLALATRWKRLVALPVAVASVYLSIGM